MKILTIMARKPEAGRAKTRLCPPLTPEQAAELYRGLLLDSIALIGGLPGIRPAIAYAPADAVDFFRSIAPGVLLIAQQGETLSERLAHVSAELFAAGAETIGLMSSDSPSIPPAVLIDAFAGLQHADDFALGPTDDGGYYLAALRRHEPRLYLDVTMSTPTVAADTLRIAAELGLRSRLLPGWYDIDGPDDLQRLRQDRAALLHTRAALAAIDTAQRG
jgi:rSAM/selenodomain-associated transferase 1